MEKKMRLIVTTNDGNFLDEQVDYVLLPLKDGEMGILPGHDAIVGALKKANVKYRIEEEEFYVYVAGGIASVLKDEIVLLCKRAEKGKKEEQKSKEN